MILDSNTFKPVSFPEYKILRPDQDNGSGFEIILDAEFSMNYYCQVIYQKIYDIKESKIAAFFDYQCSFYRNPLLWLNALEKLANINFVFREGNEHTLRHMKLVAQFAIKRFTLQLPVIHEPKPKGSNKKVNGFSDDKEYCFAAVMETLQKYDIMEEKVAYLHSQKTAYKQNPPEYIWTRGEAFDVQCQLQIELLIASEDLLQKARDKKANIVKQSSGFQKIRLNGNLNVLGDFFFQLLNEIKVGPKPLIAATPTQIATLINMMFLDKDGFEISPHSVLAILDPNKPGKRPKGNKRIQLDENVE